MMIKIACTHTEMQWKVHVMVMMTMIYIFMEKFRENILYN